MLTIFRITVKVRLYFSIQCYKICCNILYNLFQNGKYDEVLLFVTDVAPYTIKLDKAIENQYSKIMHTTCLAHERRRMAKKIRN